MKIIRLITAIWPMAAFMTSCSLYMAANRPERRDVHVLDRGTPRNYVIAELGAPVHSTVEKGKVCDIFSFFQGYTKCSKASWAIFHGTADVFTYGLWEAFGTPMESENTGTLVQVEVLYDKNDCVDTTRVIKGARELIEVNSIKQVRDEESTQ